MGNCVGVCVFLFRFLLLFFFFFYGSGCVLTSLSMETNFVLTTEWAAKVSAKISSRGFEEEIDVKVSSDAHCLCMRPNIFIRMHCF